MALGYLRKEITTQWIARETQPLIILIFSLKKGEYRGDGYKPNNLQGQLPLHVACLSRGTPRLTLFTAYWGRIEARPPGCSFSHFIHSTLGSGKCRFWCCRAWVGLENLHVSQIPGEANAICLGTHTLHSWALRTLNVGHSHVDISEQSEVTSSFHVCFFCFKFETEKLKTTTKRITEKLLFWESWEAQVHVQDTFSKCPHPNHLCSSSI